jgi:hypothetical protein
MDWHTTTDTAAGGQGTFNSLESIHGYDAVGVNRYQDLARGGSCARIPDACEVHAVVMDQDGAMLRRDCFSGVGTAVQHNNEFYFAGMVFSCSAQRFEACLDVALFVPGRNDNREVHCIVGREVLGLWGYPDSEVLRVR